MKNQDTTNTTTLEKVLTKRNIIILLIVILVIFFGNLFWQNYQKATINIVPNQPDTKLTISSSPFKFNREDIGSESIKNIIDTNLAEKTTIKIDPNLYYQITISKAGYSTYINTIQPKLHETINLTPQIYTPLTNGIVNFPTIDNKNKQIIFLANNLKNNSTNLSAYELNDQTITALEDKNWLGIENIIYNPDQTKAILKVKNYAYIFGGGQRQPDPNNPDKINTTFPESVFYQPNVPDQTIMTFSYDLATKKLYYLGYFIQNITWYNNDQIIYSYLNYDYYDSKLSENDKIDTLNLANYDGTNWKTILDLKNQPYAYPKFYPSPTDKQKIILTSIPPESGQDTVTKLYQFDLTTNQVTDLNTDNTYGLSWSPDGNKIVYVQLDSKNKNLPTLWQMNSDGSNKKSLELHTIISKVHWLDNQTIIAALPIPSDNLADLSGQILPENYYNSQNTNTTDALYLIDLNTNQKTNLFTDNFKYLTNVHNIFSDSKNVYFVDNENKLYSLPLH